MFKPDFSAESLTAFLEDERQNACMMEHRAALAAFGEVVEFYTSHRIADGGGKAEFLDDLRHTILSLQRLHDAFADRVEEGSETS